MLGRFDFSQKSAVVVGGGISGLLLSYQLEKLGFEVTLIEASPRLGGLIETKQTQYGISESAAHSILLSTAVSALFEELQLPWYPVNAGSKARFIFRNGKMRRVPLGLGELLQTAKRFFYIKAPLDVRNDLTVEQWGQQFIGNAATRYLLEPALLGIYSATPDRLSAKAVFPDLKVHPGKTLFSTVRALKKRKSGEEKKKMVALVGGMQSLTDALERKLRESERVRIQTSTEFRVKDYVNTPNLALCVPAHVAARLLKAVDATASAALEKIKYVPLVSSTVFINEKDFKRKPTGVGVLFPQKEQQKVLGILFNSSSFPERVLQGNHVSLTCISGGTLHPELVLHDFSQLEHEIKQVLDRVFSVSENPIEFVHHRWPHAIPLYNQETLQAWQICKDTWCSNLGRILFGNYVGSLSIRGMIESTTVLSSSMKKC